MTSIGWKPVQSGRGVLIPDPLPSKDELAAAWLRGNDRRFWARWETAARRHLGNPRKRLKSAFALLAKHISEAAAHGCGKARIAAGAGSAAPARQAIEAHNAKLRTKLAELCVGSGAAEPERLALELFLLMESAHPTSILGVLGPELDVAPAAALLIDSRLGGAPS